MPVVSEASDNVGTMLWRWQKVVCRTTTLPGDWALR